MVLNAEEAQANLDWLNEQSKAGKITNPDGTPIPPTVHPPLTAQERAIANDFSKGGEPVTRVEGRPGHYNAWVLNVEGGITVFAPTKREARNEAGRDFDKLFRGKRPRRTTPPQ